MRKEEMSRLQADLEDAHQRLLAKEADLTTQIAATVAAANSGGGSDNTATEALVEVANKANKENARLQADVSAKEGELLNLRQAAKDSQSDMEVAWDDASKTMNKFEELEVSAEKMRVVLQKKVDAVEDDNAARKIELHEVQGQLEAARADKETAVADDKADNAAIVDLQREVARLEDDLKAAVSVSSVNVSEAEAKVKQLEASKREAVEKGNAAEVALAESRVETAAAKAAFNSETSRANRLKTEKEELEQEVLSAKASAQASHKETLEARASATAGKSQAPAPAPAASRHGNSAAAAIAAAKANLADDSDEDDIEDDDGYSDDDFQ